MKVVRSHLRMLLAEKELRAGRSISLRQVVRETGVPISTVMGLANNTLKDVPLNALAVLCDYFNCTICDLLHLEDM